MTWATVELCTDSDLTAVDSKMPGEAMLVKSGGVPALEGKRELAKSRIRKDLFKAGIDVDDADDFSSLKDAAVFLELSYIYRDMAKHTDSADMQKANYWLTEYNGEMELVRLSVAGETKQARPRTYSLYRG